MLIKTKMKIKLGGGLVVPVGDVAEVPDELALSMIGRGDAEIVKPAQSPTPSKSKVAKAAKAADASKTGADGSGVGSGEDGASQSDTDQGAEIPAGTDQSLFLGQAKEPEV
jgi:hypothetical protein